MNVSLLIGGSSKRDYRDRLLWHWLRTTFPDHQYRQCAMSDLSSPETRAYLNRQDFVVISGHRLIGRNGNVRSDFRPDEVAALKVPCLPVAVECEGEGIADEALLGLLDIWHAHLGTIPVLDPQTERFIRRLSCLRATSVTGTPPWLLRNPTSFRKSEFSLLCPHSDRRSDPWVWPIVRELYGKLVQQSPCLWLALDETDLNGVNPGPHLLYSPKAEQPVVEAILSASHVVSLSLDPVILAGLNGQKAVFLCAEERQRESAEYFHVPHLMLSRSTTAEEILQKLTDSETPRRDDLRISLESKLHYIVEALGKPKRASSRLLFKGSELVLCCIVDSNYFPLLIGFLKNLLQVHGSPLTVHILTLDEKSFTDVSQLESCYPLEVYQLSDILTAEEVETASTKSMSDRAFGVKARFVAKVLAYKKCPVLYSDVDIYFFRDPTRLLNCLQGGSALLFPQWNDSVTISHFFGLFNAGLVLVSPGAGDFLSWWATLCHQYYTSDVHEGFFVDQGFLDMAPLFFENVKIYRGRDENIAHWNLRTLDISYAGFERGEISVGSFHHSYKARDISGFSDHKVCWDQVAAFGGPGSSRWIQNILAQQAIYFEKARVVHSLFTRFPFAVLFLQKVFDKNYFGTVLFKILLLIKRIRAWSRQLSLSLRGEAEALSAR